MHGITKKQHQCTNSPFLYTQAMTKIVLPGVATQKGGKQLSLEARIDAVATLSWMTNGMDLPFGAIEKVADASIVLELAIQKIWLWIKAGETPSEIVISKKSGNNYVRIYVDETLVLQIQRLDINFRQSICDITANMGVSIGTIQELLKEILKFKALSHG